MKAVKARVRLATGNVGWYDPLTNIHLTIQRPEGIVYEGMNTSNLKKGVMYKTITVTDGSLSEPSETVIPTTVNEVVKKIKKVEIEKEITKKEIEPIVEESIEQAEVIETKDTTEETIVETLEEKIEEEKVEEEKPKKKSSNKKKKSE